MKKIIQIIGRLLIVSAIIFFLVHSFIVVSDGATTKDLFGFIIPNPPSWAYWIPYLGAVVAFFYHWFSVHGLVGVVIIVFTLGIGVNLISYSKSK